MCVTFMSLYQLRWCYCYCLNLIYRQQCVRWWKWCMYNVHTFCYFTHSHTDIWLHVIFEVVLIKVFVVFCCLLTSTTNCSHINHSCAHWKLFKESFFFVVSWGRHCKTNAYTLKCLKRTDFNQMKCVVAFSTLVIASAKIHTHRSCMYMIWCMWVCAWLDIEGQPFTKMYIVLSQRQTFYFNFMMNFAAISESNFKFFPVKIQLIG